MLIQYYSKHRDQDFLARDLMMLKSDSREHHHHFGWRIQDLKGMSNYKQNLDQVLQLNAVV